MTIGYAIIYTGIWLTIPFGLGCLGSFFGLKASLIKHPCGVNPVPKYK